MKAITVLHLHLVPIPYNTEPVPGAGMPGMTGIPAITGIAVIPCMPVIPELSVSHKI